MGGQVANPLPDIGTPIQNLSQLLERLLIPGVDTIYEMCEFGFIHL